MSNFNIRLIDPQFYGDYVFVPAVSDKRTNPGRKRIVKRSQARSIIRFAKLIKSIIGTSTMRNRKHFIEQFMEHTISRKKKNPTMQELFNGRDVHPNQAGGVLLKKTMKLYYVPSVIYISSNPSRNPFKSYIPNEEIKFGLLDETIGMYSDINSELSKANDYVKGLLSEAENIKKQIYDMEIEVLDHTYKGTTMKADVQYKKHIHKLNGIFATGPKGMVIYLKH